jgi:hypothetical protein
MAAHAQRLLRHILRFIDPENNSPMRRIGGIISAYIAEKTAVTGEAFHPVPRPNVTNV